MKHISEIIEDILVEWAYRVHDGMPNPENPMHLIHLKESLNELRLPRKVVKKVLEKVRKYKDNKMNKDLGRVGEPWGSDRGEAGSKETTVGDAEGGDKKSDTVKPQIPDKTQQNKIDKINEAVLEDLNFLVENAGTEKIKGGAGSNTPTREQVIALKDFTEKRMEQDQRRKEAEEKGEPFDEEPYVHPNVVQREIDDKTLDAGMDYLKQQLGDEGFAEFIKKQSTGGAVNDHLTKLRKKERGKVGYDEESPGYKRVREVIRLYLKNDGKSVVTGESLKFSNMELDHRIPYSSAEDEASKKMGIDKKEIGRLLGSKSKLSEEDLKKREELDSILIPAQQKLDAGRSNVDLMEIGCNQLKGSAINEGLLNKIKKSLLKNPEEEKLKREYKNERQRLLNKHHIDQFGRGDFSALNEKDLSQMDDQETSAVMKAYNYYHPNSKEMKEQIDGNPRKGKEGDPEYYNKMKEYWKGQGVELPENSEDIDFDNPPFNKWMNRYIAPKKARGRGGAVRRSVGAEREFIAEHLRSNGDKVPTIEEIDKQDTVVNEAREKIRTEMNKKRIAIEKEKLNNPNLSDKQIVNIKNKIAKLGGGE